MVLPVVAAVIVGHTVHIALVLLASPHVVIVIVFFLIAFFTYMDGVMHLMADRIRTSGLADEVMGVLASAGRNEPGPCGSGVKAKHRHQKALSSLRAAAPTSPS